MAQTPEFIRSLTGFFVFNVLTATIGPLLFGYHLAELNAPQEVITCVRTRYTTKASLSSLPQCIPMSSSQIGIVSSAVTIGGLIGALVAGSAAGTYGRLKTMRYNTAFFIIGPILEALAPTVGIMTAGRFISGLGAGAAAVVVPIYISETAPPAQKGAFGSLTQIMINLGIVITQVLGLFLSHGQYWRIILGVAGLIGLVQLGGLLFAIESPQWTAAHGEPAQARRDLRKLRGNNNDIREEMETWGVDGNEETEGEEQALLSERQRSSQNNESTKEGDIGMLTVLTNPRYSRATLTVMTIMVAQQLCGINSIVMYGVSLLSDLLSSSSATLNVVVSLVNLVLTTSFAPLVDKLGRKICLGASALGMAISSILLAIAISRGISVLSGISVLLFVGSFAFGVGPVPFILSSELVGPEAVGSTQSWALASNWLATFVVAQFFPVVNQALGKGKVYWIFAGFGIGTLLFVYMFVPETKGKKDADEVWGREAMRRRED